MTKRIKIVEEAVKRVFSAEFPHAQIDNVFATPGTDSDGDKVLNILIIFAGEPKSLDRDGLVGFARHLKSALATRDSDDLASKTTFPMLSFITKKEADKLNLEPA